MPWKETCPMNQRMKFITDHLKNEWSVVALCRYYGISRMTAYKRLARYQQAGIIRWLFQEPLEFLEDVREDRLKRCDPVLYAQHLKYMRLLFAYTS